jgi:phosphohistidine phosphatase SixA
MRLILIRHADREYAPGIPDHEQLLTNKGIKDSKKLGQVIALHENNVVAVFSSPFLRAVQTAKYLLPYFQTLQEYRVVDVLALDPPESSTALRLLVESCREKSCIALVGHKPSLEQLVTDLCNEKVNLKKAHALCLELDDNLKQGRLLWSLGPKSAAFSLPDEEEF